MKQILLAICPFFFYSTSFSQVDYTTINGIKVEAYSTATEIPLIVSVNKTKNISIEKFPQWFKKEFLQNENESLVLSKIEKDPFGTEHYRFIQKHMGLKIENTMLLVHCDQACVKSFNGDWFSKINLSNTISLTEQQALQFALNKVNAKKYKWQNEAAENHMKLALKDSSFSYKPKGELMIFPIIDLIQKTTTFLYAYKFNIYAEVPLYRANLLIDASTGNCINEQNLICTANIPATANTKYSGVQTITTDNAVAGSYRLRETGRGNGIETYNLNNGTAYINTDFTNNSTTWSSTGSDQIATDAHWGAEKTYDYFKSTFNRNSIDDNGYPLLSYVHYGVDFTNAFWDGQCMTYGDGNLALGRKEYTELDVCGHEITHGIVQYTAQLNGGESDALNEAFADIFGTSVEWYARPTQSNWLLGDEIKTNGTPFRDMSNPNAFQQPDTYLGNDWDHSGEPHTNNGPCIYWYYLLSVGGSGTNDNGQNYTITGISMQKASAISYRALSVYMTPNTDYNSVRLYTIQAAKDLYGSCSNEVIQTTNAWNAVGVGALYTTGSIAPEFIADITMNCTVPTTVQFTNQTNNASSYTWRFGDGNTSTAANPVHTYTANGIYSVKLIASSCSGSTMDSIFKTAYIDINTSNPCSFSMSGQATTNNSCTGILYDDGGATLNYSNNTHKKFTIALATGNTITLNFNHFDMELNYDSLYIYRGPAQAGNLIDSYTGNSLPNNGAAIITNTNVITIVQTSDGYTTDSGFEMLWNCSASSTVSPVSVTETDVTEEISVYPNPAQNQLTVSNINRINLIELINALGQTEQSFKIDHLTSTTLFIDNLSAGIYFIKLHSSNTIITRKIIKQ